MAHGLGLYAYADVTNFSPHFNHLKMMEGIATDEQRSRESFVEHFRSKYTSEPYLPIWMVTELISFGALSTMYSGLRRSLQRRIADEFGVPEGAFRTWLHTLNYVRNSCAHHNRLWNRKLAIKPALPHKWPYLTPENDKLYTVLVVMLHMLGYIAPKCRWKDRTMHLLLEHPRVPLRLMGFPENWASLWPWSLSEI